MNEPTTATNPGQIKSDIMQALDSLGEYHLRLILAFVKRLAKG